MKLPEYFDVRYDPNIAKSYLHFNYDKYLKYDLTNIVEQNEIRTGLQLLFKMWKVVSNNVLLHLEIDDHHFSLGEYRYYCEKYFDLKPFSIDDMSCFWSVLSRFYPFTEEELMEYMKYLNVKELSKNMFVCISDDGMDLIKCYHELNG